jgi:hypothetical protein
MSETPVSGPATKLETYDIPVAGAMAGLGRNASYAAAKRGEIPTIKFGRKRRVPAKRWHKILDGDAA